MKQLLTFLKKKLNKFFFIFGILFFPLLTEASCPVCVVVAIGGVGLSRWLGIDDTISGIWIGGILMSLVILTIEWLDKKKVRFFFRKPLIFIFWYLTAIWPLLKLEVFGQIKNKIWGVDKLILGITLGSVFLLLGFLIHKFLKNKKGGESYFPFQKVVIPISFLIVLSFFFYFLTK